MIREGHVSGQSLGVLAVCLLHLFSVASNHSICRRIRMHFRFNPLSLAALLLLHVTTIDPLKVLSQRRAFGIGQLRYLIHGSWQYKRSRNVPLAHYLGVPQPLSL